MLDNKEPSSTDTQSTHAQIVTESKEASQPTSEFEQLLEEHADNPERLYELGKDYEYGLFVKSDSEKALACYQKAADQNYALAQYKLGIIYEKLGNLAESRKFYEKAAENNHIEAELRLGMLYVNHNDYKAYRSFYMAERKISILAKDFIQLLDNSPATIPHGLDSKTLETIKSDYYKVVRDNCHLYSYFKGLHDLVDHGQLCRKKGVNKNATACYKKAAEYGSTVAKLKLAMLCKDKENYLGLSEKSKQREFVKLLHEIIYESANYPSSFSYSIMTWRYTAHFEKFANPLTIPQARYYLGLCYEMGHVVETNIQRASQLFESSAAAGYGPAKGKLTLKPPTISKPSKTATQSAFWSPSPEPSSEQPQQLTVSKDNDGVISKKNDFDEIELFKYLQDKTIPSKTATQSAFWSPSPEPSSEQPQQLTVSKGNDRVISRENDFDEMDPELFEYLQDKTIKS